MPEVKDDLRQDVAAPAVDTARPPDRPGLRAWSPVDPDREILCLLHGPVNVLEFEEVARKEAALKRELAAELDARRQGPLEQERVASVLPAPESPSTRCVEAMVQSWSNGQVTTSPSSVLLREGSLVHLATDERPESEQEAWATALVLFHVATGWSCFTSVETKGAV